MARSVGVPSEPADRELAALLARIRSCRICRDTPQELRLAHEPRPVVRASSAARLLVASQAPGIRVHLTGLPFNDPSGDRLRQWMGVSRDLFYDETRVAIVPMGFCFPGHNATKGDLPPRRECRAHWHDALFDLMPQIETVLVIGRYAQDYHFNRLGLPNRKDVRLEDVVRDWRAYLDLRPRLIALPHPSWRNSGWLKRNPWFDAELVPMLRGEVARALS